MAKRLSRAKRCSQACNEIRDTVSGLASLDRSDGYEEKNKEEKSKEDGELVEQAKDIVSLQHRFFCSGGVARRNGIVARQHGQCKHVAPSQIR